MLITASKRGDNTLRSCSNVFISSSPRIVRRTPRGITTSANNPESFCSIFGEVQLRFLFSIKCEKKSCLYRGTHDGQPQDPCAREQTRSRLRRTSTTESRRSHEHVVTETCEQVQV